MRPSKRRYMMSTPVTKKDDYFTRKFKEARIKKVLFMVRLEYYEDIVSGAKKEEIRADIKHWRWLTGADPPRVAVFMCGKRIHRRVINRIYHEFPEVVLGRPVSEQGRKDLRLEGRKLPQPCIVVELGDVYNEE